MPQGKCLGQYVSIKPVVLAAVLNASVLLRWPLSRAGAVEQPCGAITCHWKSGQICRMYAGFAAQRGDDTLSLSEKKLGNPRCSCFTQVAT